ncbi:MAG: hypothetical protein WC928_02585 [Patescibacteria group bacterium]|jgi:hypothetical protein
MIWSEAKAQPSGGGPPGGDNPACKGPNPPWWCPKQVSLGGKGEMVMLITLVLLFAVIRSLWTKIKKKKNENYKSR